jgi:site-specific recombinase XerC
VRETFKYLTEEELRKLFGAIHSVRDRAIFQVAFWRGLRASEVGMLQVADVRLKLGRIRVTRCKGSRGGEFLMADEELRALRAWLRVRGYDPGPVFCSRQHRPISRSMLHRLMRRYGAAAGLPTEKCHFHVLRHSIGTWLMSQPDAELRHVQDWLGHVNIQNTVKYSHMTNPQRDRFAKRIFGRT